MIRPIIAKKRALSAALADMKMRKACTLVSRMRSMVPASCSFCTSPAPLPVDAQLLRALGDGAIVPVEVVLRRAGLVIEGGAARAGQPVDQQAGAIARRHDNEQRL